MLQKHGVRDFRAKSSFSCSKVLERHPRREKSETAPYAIAEGHGGLLNERESWRGLSFGDTINTAASRR
jgi:hypothetical protein